MLDLLIVVLLILLLVGGIAVSHWLLIALLIVALFAFLRPGGYRSRW
jgi:hypothetical protein